MLAFFRRSEKPDVNFAQCYPMPNRHDLELTIFLRGPYPPLIVCSAPSGLGDIRRGGTRHGECSIENFLLSASFWGRSANQYPRKTDQFRFRLNLSRVLLAVLRKPGILVRVQPIRLTID